MLLIAQPKSASTSTAVTIAQIGRLKLSLGVPKNKANKLNKEFKELSRYHNNIVERNENFIKTTSESKITLFKEHLLPTPEHLEFLNKYKNNIIILLRYPEDSLDNYLRMFKKNGRKNYKEKELLNDLRCFHDRYMWWASNKRYAIVIYYKDLIQNYKSTMLRILKHFDIKSKKLIPLKKLNYTGIGEKRIGRKM